MPEQPLHDRLYFREPYWELARLVGYAGFPFRELDERLKPLFERFGKMVVEDARRELLTLFFNGKSKRSGRQEDAEVQLNPEVRRLCWQLLGPPPEYRPSDMMERVLRRPDPIPVQPQVREKKPRRKRAPAPPAMQQFQEAKERHPGMLLLFRMGDFYELFDGDAETAAKVLGLTLTSRDKTTMAGFPHHALEANLKKLLQTGQRVAICEPVAQTGARGPLRRDVTRVVTPESECPTQ